MVAPQRSRLLLSSLLCCHLVVAHFCIVQDAQNYTHIPIRRNRGRIILISQRTNVGICRHHFSLNSTGHNLVMYSHLDARKNSFYSGQPYVHIKIGDRYATVSKLGKNTYCRTIYCRDVHFLSDMVSFLVLTTNLYFLF